MKNLICNILPRITLACLIVTLVRPGNAQEFYTTNSTINIPIVKGYIGVNAAPPIQTVNTSPTVSVISGGSVGYGLFIYKKSIVNFTAGIIQAFSAFNTSTVNISGGSYGLMFATNSGTINITGGIFIPGTAGNTSGNSTVNIKGGQIGYDNYLVIGGGSTLNVYGCGLELTKAGGYGGLALKGHLADGNTINTTVYSGGGRINLHTVNPPPKIVRVRATTLDAKSVTISYTISEANVVSYLQFAFYRSHQKAVDNSSTLIGTRTVGTSDVDQQGNKALNAGVHVVSFAGLILPPIPQSLVHQGRLYMIAVANNNGTVIEDPASVDTVYFQMHLLGAITHGYDPIAISSYFWATPSWMDSMNDDLINLAGFDHVIEFNWEQYCTIAAPCQATGSGLRMTTQVLDEVVNLCREHAGDTGDVHFIGHSRGAVVVVLPCRI